MEKDRIVIASDVSDRNGIVVEVFRNDKLVVEIFRDDSEKTRTITGFTKDISLESMEEAIDIFKREIPCDFIKYDET